MIYFTFHITRPTIALNYQIDQICIIHSNKISLQKNILFHCGQQSELHENKWAEAKLQAVTACVTSPGRNKGR